MGVESQIITVPIIGTNQDFVVTQNYTNDTLKRIKSYKTSSADYSKPHRLVASLSIYRYGNPHFADFPKLNLGFECI
jgi:hypothetical protein